jgi:hypothetical protein
MKYINDITNDIDSNTLSIILNRHNIQLKQKKKNPQYKKFTEGFVLSSYITTCNYTGGINYDGMKEQKHLHIKFVSDVEDGIINLSVLLDDYNDLLPSI